MRLVLSAGLEVGCEELEHASGLNAVLFQCRILNLFSLPQPTVKLFINGQFVESKTDNWIDNFNPVSIYRCRKTGVNLQFMPLLGDQ